MSQKLTVRCLTKLKPYALLSATTTMTSSPIVAATTSTAAAVAATKETETTINVPVNKLEEQDVGVLCYISQLPGFRGILKQRYSDFIVNEVDLDGNVVHLTSLDLPPEMVGEEEQLPEQLNKSYTTEIDMFRSLAGDSDAERLNNFIDKIRTGAEDSTSPLVLSPSSDKLHRTAVHNFFKEKLKFLVTDTVDGPEASSKCIRVRLDSGGNQNKGRSSRKRKDRGHKPFDSRGSDDWLENRGKFLRFHLYKENKDTQEALRLIGKLLGVQSRSFGFAGTKDKRSVSTQRVTIFKQRASRLASLNERLIGIKVGDFCHVNEGLLLGQLRGNRFTITLRGVIVDSEDTIRASADALGKHGFINYFGLQRFGSGTVPTHFIGATLLRGEWKTAVDLILDPREGDILLSFLHAVKTTIGDAVRKIREYYKESNDIDGTLRQLPHNMVAERAILQGLKKCPGNYLQALRAIPRTLRMMFVHSYQSYLWNHAASIRVQKYGADRVVLGDLVYCKEDSCSNAVKVNNSEYEGDVSDDAFNCSNLGELPVLDLPEDGNHPVKAVDSEDLLRGDYTIDDIVLPLPGSRTTYPTNDICDIYRDLAKQDKISLKESVHSVKEFSITGMTGAYRQVFQRPLDFEWEILKYSDGNRPLAETDLDIIAKSKLVTEVNHTDAANIPDSCEGDVKLLSSFEADGERENFISQVTQMALKLGFTLPASSYATMAIRELLKTSTSVAFHKTLNNQT
ncbi:hypothetical protein Nepgr_001453 [Nepenthes gracilis]|uniref:TRUD domain-containing protein n=1 Tax=Nepenthes gracilis TaxID=150966 RepID=A0AAD3RX14_NEPGR|nr:hypothetical protein Nepgr_001453 [Nepenthes gracilis]